VAYSNIGMAYVCAIPIASLIIPTVTLLRWVFEMPLFGDPFWKEFVGDPFNHIHFVCCIAPQ